MSEQPTPHVEVAGYILSKLEPGFSSPDSRR
jgi:hypothetical protein